MPSCASLLRMYCNMPGEGAPAGTRAAGASTSPLASS